MYISTKESDQGFSLIEVMVAVSIIAIALTAAFSLQSRGLTLANEARFDTTASLLAQKKIAEIEAGNPEDITTSSGDFDDDYPGYKWEISIQDNSSLKEDISECLRQVNVKISRGDDEKYQYHLRVYSFVPVKK